MQIQQLGHAVLKVRDLGRSEAFYNGILGLPIAARLGDSMTFFTLGDHHDLAVMAVGADAPSAPANAPGLAHIAFKVGDTTDELRAVMKELEAAGVKNIAPVDHTVTQSLYFDDPDGNTVELYVDVSDVWRDDPQSVAAIAPLEL